VTVDNVRDVFFRTRCICLTGIMSTLIYVVADSAAASLRDVTTVLVRSFRDVHSQLLLSVVLYDIGRITDLACPSVSQSVRLFLTDF